MTFEEEYFGDPVVLLKTLCDLTPFGYDTLGVSDHSTVYSRATSPQKKRKQEAVSQNRNDGREVEIPHFPIQVYWPRDYLINDSIEIHYDRERAKQIDEMLMEWVKEEGLAYGSEDVRTMIQEITLGALATGSFPKGDINRQLWVAKYNVLLALADDLFAEHAIKSMKKAFDYLEFNRWNIMVKWADMVLPGNSINDMPKSLRKFSLLRAWEQACDEVKATAPDEWLTTFHWTLIMYVKGCYLENLMSEKLIPYTYADYCAVRVHTSACLTNIAFVDWVQGYNASYDGCPIINILKKPGDEALPYQYDFMYFVNGMVLGTQALLNDMFSGYRESKVDSCMNALKALENIHPEMDIYRHSEIITRSINDMLIDSEDVLEDALKNRRIVLKGHPIAETYIQDCRIMTKGMTDWQVVAARYIKYLSNVPDFPRYSIEYGEIGV